MKRLIKLFYLLKPLIPRRLQIVVRSSVVRRKRTRYQNNWPVLNQASKKPKDWYGWPEGRDFALILRHDVESIKGLDRCRELTVLEKELGFCSSYNFVVHKYEVPMELIQYLWSNNFEVGIHGVFHDGKLYKSRNIFTSRASIINEYIDRWNSKGFASPSSHHKLEWLHQLNIEYDSSTFDVDPFEPQSDNVSTIFPFLVISQDSSRCYVELPYTLPQDYTLFTLMREKNIDVWKEKFQWIADKGGMALVNTHPDYMYFGEEKGGYGEYPSQYYFEFLKHIKDTYKNRYWNVLPYLLANFWKNTFTDSK